MNLIPSLDERLNTVYDLFPVCEYGADIGADHGRLSCKLLASNKVQEMQITDISQESLKKARALIQKHELSQRARFLVGDGLFALQRPVNAFAICGMGGEVIGHILQNGISELKGTTMVLCPQTDVDIVRETISNIGYTINEQIIASSRGRMYCVIRACPGESFLSEKEIFLGPCLMKKHDQKTQDYFKWRYQVEKCIQDNNNAQRLSWLSEVID